MADVESLSSEHAAKLERAASSGLATTSAGAVPAFAVQRRRFNGSSDTDGRQSGARANAFRSSREFQPREYTTYLSNASSFAELEQLFELGRRHDINAIHIATLWTRLAKLVSAPATSTSPAAPRGTRGSSDSTGPGTAAAVSRPDPAALAAFVGSLEAVTTAEQLMDMAPRGLANVVWAAAKLKTEAVVAEGSGPSSLSSSTSSSSSGGGGVEAGQATAAAAEGEASAKGQQQQQRLGGVGAAKEEEEEMGGVEAGASVSGFPPESGSRRPRTLRIRGGKKALAAAAAAAAAAAEAERRLSSTVVSEALLDAWAMAAGRKLSLFNMQDISNVVWALGRLGYQPRGLFMTQLSIAVLKELPRADRPQQISNVLLGLALLRFTPAIKDFWPPVWEAVQRLVLAEQKENPDVQGVTNTLWALSHLTTECPNSMPPVPSQLVSKAVFRAVQYGDRLSGQQCQDVFLSLPRLGFKPSEYQASKLLALALRVLPGCDGQALSTILVSLVQLQVQPWHTWKTAALAAFKRLLPTCSPEALARFVFAWAHMRLPPPAWMPQIWEKLHREVHALTSVDIAFVVLGANQLFERLPRRAKDAPPPPPGENDDGEPSTSSSASSSPSSSSVSAAAATPAITAAPAATAAAASRRRRSLKKATAAAGGAFSKGMKGRLPSRQLLLALRERWEAAGPEAQLRVVFAYRALVQEFFDALGTSGRLEEEEEEEESARGYCKYMLTGAGPCSVDDFKALMEKFLGELCDSIASGATVEIP
ncbi:hypothetical protein VOLCADRAFT_116508 [Volvox carteri f. nagariensis]|uniref:Uncharacterized protein n=1 Tax=Volvox carteri f. nagariensis TaxID=3068 RepID=D8TMM7_VOLCA|nr:uncharacterized protein VOLCADRAFT_116508 [Volvox carteri f. nagariensis]EFJ51284.1 hypothetical protein VOLCADRAFT_116508 [Volvox carteri f. nagariensis]|eukprot:XP_002947751.1 hypothetical protein VOLCADRAFT_116508 [Volvox carteri f. nagariensis]